MSAKDILDEIERICEKVKKPKHHEVYRKYYGIGTYIKETDTLILTPHEYASLTPEQIKKLQKK